jgi:hypothetical protein
VFIIKKIAAKHICLAGNAPLAKKAYKENLSG